MRRAVNRPVDLSVSLRGDNKMALWIVEGTVEGRDCAVLVSSDTERPLNLPLFADLEEAEEFLAFAKEGGCADVRRLSGEELEAVHDKWIVRQLALQAAGRS
jgi:hypothetical protein